MNPFVRYYRFVQRYSDRRGGYVAIKLLGTFWLLPALVILVLAQIWPDSMPRALGLLSLGIGSIGMLVTSVLIIFPIGIAQERHKKGDWADNG